jgi:hypothetical protein
MKSSTFPFFYFIDLTGASNDSKSIIKDNLNENDETVQESLELQNDETSFTQEQIDALEQGI